MKAHRQRTFFVDKISDNEFVFENWPENKLSKTEYQKLVKLLESELGVIHLILFCDYSKP
jgi:hypothetical protein